jgi:hypothetical protein
VTGVTSVQFGLHECKAPDASGAVGGGRRQRDEDSVRVTNLSKDVTEGDLQELVFLLISAGALGRRWRVLAAVAKRFRALKTHTQSHI